MASNHQLTTHEIAIFSIMILGVLAATIGSHTVGNEGTSAFLAIIGGSAVALGGAWVYRISERRGEYDERYHQIALRGGGISLWVLYWAIFVWSQVESNIDITTPVLDPLTWLLAVPWVVFGLTYLYYRRVM